jgi:hypothetical protein
MYTIVLSYFDAIDKSMSDKIHSMKSNISMDYAMYLPASIFNPMFMPLLLLAVSYMYPTIEMELSDFEDVRDLTPEK